MIIYFILIVLVLVLLIIYFYKDNFSAITGQTCIGPDPNSVYQTDYNLNCTLSSCKPGYIIGSTGCIINQSPQPGDLCNGSDPNSIYTIDSTNKCVVNGCNNGYTMSTNNKINTCTYSPGIFCPFGSDPNGFYTYDINSNCKLHACNTNYSIINDRCVRRTNAPIITTTASCPSGFISTTYNTTGCMLNPSNPLNITDFSSISSVPPGVTFSGTNLSTNQQRLVNAFGNYKFLTQWYPDISGPMGGPIFSLNNNDAIYIVNSWDRWLEVKSAFNNVSGFPNNYMNIGSNLIASMNTIATNSGLSAIQLATNLVASSMPINGGIWTVIGRSSQNTPSQYIMNLNIRAFAQYCTN